MQFKELKYTYHAIEEAKNELGRATTDEDARRFIARHLQQATFISEIMSESGKIDRLYAHRRYAFVLDRYEDVVITVYRRENVHEDIRNKVRELLFKELEQLNAQEKQLKEENLAAYLELEILRELHKAGIEEAGWLGARALRRWDQSEKELFKFRLEKSKLAKGIAAYM